MRKGAGFSLFPDSFASYKTSEQNTSGLLPWMAADFTGFPRHGYVIGGGRKNDKQQSIYVLDLGLCSGVLCHRA